MFGLILLAATPASLGWSPSAVICGRSPRPAPRARRLRINLSKSELRPFACTPRRSMPALDAALGRDVVLVGGADDRSPWLRLARSEPVPARDALRLGVSRAAHVPACDATNVLGRVST